MGEMQSVVNEKRVTQKMIFRQRILDRTHSSVDSLLES